MKPNQFAMKLFNIGTQNYTDHVIVSNDGDFGWDSFHEDETYIIPYNDGLKKQINQALQLSLMGLLRSVRSNFEKIRKYRKQMD